MQTVVQTSLIDRPWQSSSSDPYITSLMLNVSTPRPLFILETDEILTSGSPPYIHRQRNYLPHKFLVRTQVLHTQPSEQQSWPR